MSTTQIYFDALFERTDLAKPPRFDSGYFRLRVVHNVQIKLHGQTDYTTHTREGARAQDLLMACTGSSALEQLPDEILFAILHLLDIPELHALSQVYLLPALLSLDIAPSSQSFH